MNIRHLLFLALLTSGLITASGEEEKKPAKQEDTTELGEQMDHLGSAFRKLRRQAGDATKNATSLDYVATMQQAAAAALALIPAKAGEIPEAERAKFIAAYRKQMEKFIATLDELEAALKAGDNATALKLVSELSALQKAGHKEYKKPDRD